MEEKAISYGTEDNEGVDPHLWMTFAEYLINIGSTLLGSHPNNHTGSSPTRHNPLVTGFKFCLETQEGVEIVQRFLNSGECSVLLVELMQDNRVVLSAEVKSLPSVDVKSSFVLIKNRDLPIDIGCPIPPQVQAVSLLFESQISDNSIEARQNLYLHNMHQVTRHLLTPLARSIKQPTHESLEHIDESDQIFMLQKRIRELDFALEQCQRGSAIPSIVLPVPTILQEASKKTSVAVLRNHLERYNATQVDILLQEIGVTTAMGDSEESRDEFANEVNKTAKLWPAELLRQTRLIDTPFAGSVEKEINFWKDLDKKLNETKEQLENAPILLTKLVLKRTNRVSEQLISEAESSLDKATKTVTVALSFLRDYPIGELQAATSLQPKLPRAISNCLSHFGKLKHSTYEFGRAMRLFEVLGSNVIQRIIAILREKNVMQCSIEDLRVVKTHFDEVLSTWRTSCAAQMNTMKDIAKRRSENFIKPKFDFEFLQIRMNNIVDFREQHEKMLTILSTVLVGSDGDFLTELSEAYQVLVRTNTDIFDLSSNNGNLMWSTSVQHYEKRLEKIEDRITRILDERLHAAKTADEMFRIFALFNPLFFRPSIRNAVNSFRATLMKSVREDVKRLQDKFKLRYDESHERVTSELRDIPPLSGRIIWARQIENQLTMLMKRIQDVLGVGWEDHMEGKQLKEVCDELKSYLDTNQIYQEWINQQLKSDGTKYSKVKDFLLLVEEDPRTGVKNLKVNFDDKQVVIYKEVKYLEWLLPSMSVAHKQIPTSIQARSLEAYNRYPIALALESALASYAGAKAKINNSNSPLLVSHMQAVRDVIKDAMGGSKRSKWIKWDTKELLNDWVSLLVNKIYNLQERVDDVNEKIKTIEKHVNELTNCEYDRTRMETILASIQSVVDELPMKGLSNVVMWVNQLDKRIENVLVEKMKQAIDAWCAAFSLDFESGNNNGIRPNKNGTKDSKIAFAGFILDPYLHEIILSNQVLSVQPPLEQTKKTIFNEYHQYLAIAATLPRLIAQRYQVFAEASKEQKDYSSILQTIGVPILKKPYILVESKMVKAKEYVVGWLQYQTLWDASVSAVTDHLERDLSLWQKLLSDIRVARSSVDSVHDEKSFGAVVINHRSAQSKINLKYDTWQKECQSRFGAILLQEIKSMHVEIVGIKTKLESLSLEGSTKDAITAVEYILKAKSRVNDLDAKTNALKSSEKLLQTQRFAFPSEWLPVSNVVGAYEDMCNILDRRNSAMNAQLHALQQKIKEEDVAVNARAEKFIENWNVHKPIEGGIAASTALETISMYAGQLSKLLEETQRLRGAKESLNMDYISDDRLNFVEAEINDLRDAWNAIAPISDKLVALAATLMKDINPTTVRKNLEELINEIKGVPSKVRSYAAVETVLDKIQKYLAFQPVLRDLCTDALKDRHWKILLDKLGVKQQFKSLSIGMIWDSNAMQQRKGIQEVLATAQGELALEQFLRDVRDHWISRELVVSSRDGAKIIAGWESLFSTLEDNLVSLASLKQSPYFRNVPEFQEDSVNWETRLTNLRSIFDVWVEVQRKWIYLRGIFRNADIKAQLPAQYSKFKSIDNEYTGLMKRVSAKPVVLDILQLDNLQRQLEREDSTMALIQKALGEYLEKQRQIFPRFYFVNNDDLIEIIGNANEPTKIMVHLGKMFAAISSLKTNFEQGIDLNEIVATAMISKEGEMVPLNNQINMGSGVKEWLSSLRTEMASTLATLLEQASMNLGTSDSNLLNWMNQYPAQVNILSTQLFWTRLCEEAVANGPKTSKEGLINVLKLLDTRLQSLSSSVLQDMDPDLRRKCEQLLTEMVHQRDVVRLLISSNVTAANDFGWLYHLRFYWNPKESDLMQRLSIKMSNASFHYGFEYLGVGERLVQTPLTDRCYLTLTQALHFRMGANPFGPAGTGKTESVKMLGSQLGRFVLVFNCDSSFDYAAMGRIFSGLCQVGAWGCFDEFNRLEERILSAVSQQILTIQRGLMSNLNQIDLLGQPCKLSKDVGIFVTLNPGYAGRSNLPDNLKQLFRAVAMSVPDRKLIAQVMLFSQGIATAEDLAGKIVLLFVLCEEQLSSQSHYDFGLRALKSVLVGAGELKRKALAQSADYSEEQKENLEEMETKVLIKSTCNSVLPKLIAEDIPLFMSLLGAVFPGCQLPAIDDQLLIDTVKAICAEESLEATDSWIEKILQLKQIQDIRHGIMLVGPSGTGKTSTWRTLLKALGKIDGVKGDAFVIDPKSIKKEKLFGSLDPNTLEWTDGIFTKILRKLTDPSSVRGTRRSWIVFDGDVDPEWAENLNSVLDDNKVLTLPSGDRLKIPPNVRIIMEVDNLKYATLATVSRCGMIWFASNTVTLEMSFKYHLGKIQKEEIRSLEGSTYSGVANDVLVATQTKFVEAITPYFLNQPSIIETALKFSLQEQHIMEATSGRLLETLFSMLARGIGLCLEYNESNTDFPMPDAHIESYASKWLFFCIIWSFGSSLSIEKRSALGRLLEEHCNVNLPNNKVSLIDLQPNIQDGEWMEWNAMVPRMEIESHKVSSSDVVVTTTDTVRHAEVMKAWLLSRKPLVLCGPPGSGKTMTLTSVLENIPEFILASLNFSSGTTPELILKTFAQYCEVVDSPDGLVLQPNRQSYRDNQWLVVFCDEINLPAQDSYGTQRVIMFLRQLTEQGGYWNHECKWIHLRRIQFVGACNPPTDAGRVDMSQRFLRHAPVLLVDYPAESSLKQIYRCFNQALLCMHPSLKGFTDPLNDAMVEFYMKNKERFTPDMAPQYIYSPRELSRWVRAMYEAMEPLDTMSSEELVRLWGHEALRLFQDRLIDSEDKEWCNKLVDNVAARNFPGVDVNECLKRPILYSQWIKKTYQSTDREVLREFVAARLKVFYEEELDVPLVIFDEVLDHVLRIDNVLRHPMGHLLLVGESGTGKTVLTKFVAWMNGLSIFQIKANSRYTLEQFDDDLRSLLRRVGVDGEKICFIFDESNALSSAFLERMNALLASGEIPGLFEGDERTQLMSACRESFNQREGLVLDSEDELYRRFTRMIQRNLHVVFTMNPASSDFENRCTTSPALFNRCVVDWFGTWSTEALAQVAHEFTRRIDTGYTEYDAPPLNSPETLLLVKEVMKSEKVTLNEALVAALVTMHGSAKTTVIRQGKTSGRQHYLSPRDFLDLIHKFTTTEEEKRSALEDQQSHVRTGLQKLLETQDQVAELNKDLNAKNEILRVKDLEANQKLSQMVEKQNEAEQRKVIAESLTVELQQQNEEIRIRKETVERELSEAEPALISAKQSVQNIRKSQLDEVRALARPPKAVQLTMEMVCVMIGETNIDWAEIRKVIRRDDFIATVVNFDPLSLTPKQIKNVQDSYLSNSEVDYAAVDRASKACGPLYQWASSQIKYATILKKIKPLRDEMAALELKSQDLTVRQQEAVVEVGELEGAIQTYKSEYAAAIRETEIIRGEMQSVSKRVSRANALLASLQEEKIRWEATALSFDQQMSTLIGDCLLSAAFLTYAGIFDHKLRARLMLEWSEAMESMKIPFRSELDMISYLSKPTDQLSWIECGLPNDSLAIQNAILLERYNRFPLVIDPSGQAMKFLLKKFSAQKMVLTSFLDSSFMKTLASAIRFGTPLLVQDVESLDPVLNPVLNRELQRTGGRTLIRLGNEDIDFSPKFMVILLTRNPLAKFAPDLCSRVTTVNFTITPASLESQVLSEILKSERPDVDKRRSDVLRLQGEQNAKLRELQDTLLDCISQVQGAILDDDIVINTLENIKAEAGQLHAEVSRTSEILEEVKAVSNIYLPLAAAVSNVYFTLESLAEISFLYQYSLQFFLTIVANVLRKVSSSSVSEMSESAKVVNGRVRNLKSSFFNEIIRRVLPGLRYEDKLVFLVRTAQIATHDQPSLALTDAETDFLTKGSSQVDASAQLLQKYKAALPDGHISDVQAKQLLGLGLLPSFAKLSASFSANTTQWIQVMEDAEAEKIVPVDWLPDNCPQERATLLKALVIRALRPERVLVALEDYISAVFDNLDFDWRDHSNFNLKFIVENDSSAAIPLMLCSQPGQDASGKVDALSSALDKRLLQVSMGSAEGFAEAEKIIAQATKTGSWVLLRNVHLCTEWLGMLEKKLYGMSFHESFRLFLTCEIHDKLPTALLRRSEVMIFESSSGMKANLQRFFMSIPSTRIDRQPAERGRLYGLLAWFNAVVQERLRYAPLGWTKRYEFSESDLACSLDVIDQWVDEVAGQRAHIDPEQLPWQALRTLISESLYGGRVDHSFDQIALDAFVQSVFSPINYSGDAILVRDTHGQPLVSLPDSLSRSAFEGWIKSLPDSNPPSWIGLPSTAERQLKRHIAQKALSHLAIVNGLAELESASQEHVAGAGDAQLRPQRKQLMETLNHWLSLLTGKDTTQQIDSVIGALSSISTVLGRTLLREAMNAKKVLRIVSHDLLAMRSYITGETKLTNAVRDLLACYKTGVVPNHWKSLYTSVDNMPLIAWIEDLAGRLENVCGYKGCISMGNKFSYAIGKMFMPEAFILATRQETAQANQWSLEDLELYLDIGGDLLHESQPFDTSINGLLLQGATWMSSDRKIGFSDDLRCTLPGCQLKWRLKNALDSKTHSSTIPIYINENRKQLVSQVIVSTTASVAREQWAQRSVAFVLQPPLV